MSSFEERLYCDGKYRIQIRSYEMRMSHWVDGPLVQRCRDNHTIIDCSDNLWHLDCAEEAGDELILSMRKYDGHRGSVEVRILDGGNEFSFQGERMTHARLLEKLDAF